MFLGFIYIHILHHANEHPIYGSWMMDELRTHGYSMSAGTLYPLLHRMEDESLLVSEKLSLTVNNVRTTQSLHLARKC